MISISLSITISISIEKNKFTCNSNNIGFIQIISPFHICTLDNEKPSSHILNTFTYFKHPLSTTHFSSSPPLFCLEALFSRLGLQRSCQAILPHGCPLHAAEFWHLYLSVDMPLPFFYGFDSLHQATHPVWTPSSAHSASNPPCQSTLPCRSLSFCSQVLTLEQTPSFLWETPSLLCRHLFTLLGLWQPALSHWSSIPLPVHISFNALPNGFRTKLFKKGKE